MSIQIHFQFNFPFLFPAANRGSGVSNVLWMNDVWGYVLIKNTCPCTFLQPTIMRTLTISKHPQHIEKGTILCFMIDYKYEKLCFLKGDFKMRLQSEPNTLKSHHRVSILIHPFLVEQIFSTKIFLASLKKLHVVHVGLHTFTGSICCISQGSLVIKVKKKIWEKKDQPWLKNKKSA